jgi:hypothetical protein
MGSSAVDSREVGHMRAVVVFESIFGNTHEIANAIAEGLGERMEASAVPVDQASSDALAGADLLVVGGPTHMHGMASSKSRQLAAEQAEKHGADLDEGATGPGLRAWLKELPHGAVAMGAAFDTRGHGPRLLTGSAARGIASRLEHHGIDLAAGPESFVVADAEGPLLDGERDRARRWGVKLAALAGARAGAS